MDKKRWLKFRYQLFHMVSVGVVDEPVNQAYDILSTGALVVNLAAAIMNTYDNLRASYGQIFSVIEAATVFFFAIDYILRFITAPDLYPHVGEGRSRIRYIFSFAGIVDLLSFLPYYLPVFFPGGTAAFRMFRVARILRLFRINAYYDSLNVITEVIISKKQQLLSSVFIISVLMIASSLTMYGLEHDAQPEVFSNAFSGIWWSTSTLLTVGYGDIYPITAAGKIAGILIAFLGVGVVAIPTGIISAGFVEQYQRLKKLGDSVEEDIRFIRLSIEKHDTWAGMKIKDLGLPKGATIAVIQRGGRTIIPRGDVILAPGDRITIGSENLPGERPANIKEVTIKRHHPWNGVAIKDIDISRQSYIYMIRRGGRMILPKGTLHLMEKDEVFLYTQLNHAAELDPADSSNPS